MTIAEEARGLILQALENAPSLWEVFVTPGDTYEPMSYDSYTLKFKHLIEIPLSSETFFSSDATVYVNKEPIAKIREMPGGGQSHRGFPH